MWDWFFRQSRRLRTGHPTSVTPEDHNAWLHEQIRAYATPQPYAAPLLAGNENWTGETWEMRQGYRRFALKEPSVKASLLTKILAVAKLDLIVKPYFRNRPEDREIAQWAKWSIGSSDGGHPAIVQKIGLHSAIDGFSVLEKVLDTVPHEAPDFGGNWTLAKAKAKDTQGIRFKLDVYKNLTGVRSMIAAQGGLDFDPSDFLIYTHLPLFESPFGISDLRAANRAANLIEAAIKLRSILLENFSGPYLVGKAEDKAVRDQIIPILREARARGYIVIPSGAEVQVINLATSAPDQFQSAIEDLRREVVTAIQGGYLQLLEGGIADGRGNTEVHAGIAMLFQWWLAVTISNCLNFGLMEDLVAPNFGYTSGLPTLQLGGIDDELLIKSLDRFKRGHELGITLSKRQVQEVGGFESPEDENDALPPPQTRQQQPGGGMPGGPEGGGGADLSSLFGPQPPEPPPDGGAIQIEPGEPEGGGTVTGSETFREQRQTQLNAPHLEFVDWKAGNSKTGKPGYVSTGGQWRAQLPKGATLVPPTQTAAQKKQATRQTAQASAVAIVNKVAGKTQLTAQELADLPTHLSALTAPQQAAVLKAAGVAVSGTKAVKVNRLVTWAAAQNQAIINPPPPPPPPTKTQVKQQAKTQAVADVGATVTKLKNRHALTPQELADFPKNLALLSAPEVTAVRQSLGLTKVPTKARQISRLVSYATAFASGTPTPAAAPAPTAPPAPAVPTPAAPVPPSGALPPHLQGTAAPGAVPASQQSGAPPTPLFTGVDTNGHHWVNGKQVAKPPDETHYETGKPQPGGSLNGVDFKSAPPKFWEKTKDVDVGEPKPLKRIDRVSVMIQEPDGRVWIAQPTNGFGNRKFTMIGGGVEKGLTDQQNALKECWEETGLHVEIIGHLGDFEDSNNGNNGRLYMARRIGGAPWDAKIEDGSTGGPRIISQKTGKPAAESETVSLVTLEKAAQLLHRTDDLAQLMTLHPPKVDTPTNGKGSEPIKKFLKAIQPKALDYVAKQKAAGNHKPGNADLHAVQEMRGFNKKPTVVKKNDFDALVAKGDHIEMLRGVSGFVGKTADQLAEQFRSGDHFPGHGCFGAGTYCDSNKGYGNAASQYAGKSGALLRIAIPKTAKIIKQSELEKLVPKEPSDAVTYGHHPRNEEWWGVQAALAGYDAIEVDGKSKRHYSYGKGYYVILNRGILTVQDTNAPKGYTIK